PDDLTTVETARKYVDSFMAGNMQLLFDHSSPELKNLIKNSKTLGTIRDQTIGKAAQTTENQVAVVYVRLVKSATGQTWSITASVSPGGELAGFQVQPAGEAPSQFLDYTTKANLRLPFDDTWSVLWGGRTVKDNYHAVSTSQRFAYDLLMTKDG